jgi:uncharacterized protein YceK
MPEYIKNNHVQEYLMVVVLMILALLTGCGSLSFSVVGKTVSEGNRIPLVESGTENAHWQTRDLTLTYRYERNQSNLSLEGTVDLDASLRNNFTYIEYFHMDVIFLDSQGKVLEMRGLISSSPEPIDRPINFRRMLTLPPGSRSIAFSYRGQARSASDETGSSTYFWEYPLH